MDEHQVARPVFRFGRPACISQHLCSKNWNPVLESHQPLRFCKPPRELLGQRDTRMRSWEDCLGLAPAEKVNARFLFGFGSGGYLLMKSRMTETQTLLTVYVEDHSDSAFQELVARYTDLVYSTAL